MCFFPDESRIPWYGTGLGFLIGVLIVVADETLTKRPVLNYTILKIILVLAVLGVGYCGALIYG